jgi:hypothetical protein
MPRRKIRHTLTTAALCALARRELEAEPTADNFTWAERIKIALVRAGFDYPPGDGVHAAMRAVERVVSRPAPTLAQPPAVEAPTSPAPLSHPEASAILEELGVRVRSVGTPAGDAAQQIADWRQAQPGPRYRKTATGWVVRDR